MKVEQLRIEATCEQCGAGDLTATGDPVWARQALAHWLSRHRHHRGVHVSTARLVRMPPSAERVEMTVVVP
mgnify:CR=1 FL=1